jgi:hypothetical protein
MHTNLYTIIFESSTVLQATIILAFFIIAFVFLPTAFALFILSTLLYHDSLYTNLQTQVKELMKTNQSYQVRVEDLEKNIQFQPVVVETEIPETTLSTKSNSLSSKPPQYESLKQTNVKEDTFDSYVNPYPNLYLGVNVPSHEEMMNNE